MFQLVPDHTKRPRLLTCAAAAVVSRPDGPVSTTKLQGDRFFSNGMAAICAVTVAILIGISVAFGPSRQAPPSASTPAPPKHEAIDAVAVAPVVAAEPVAPAALPLANPVPILAAAAAPAHVDPPIAPSMFRLTSISLGASSIAVINGQRCVVGETLGVQSAGQRADVRVDAVEDGYALLSCGSQRIQVDLDRERPRQ
jgi:hypothetical protein